MLDVGKAHGGPIKFGFREIHLGLKRALPGMARGMWWFDVTTISAHKRAEVPLLRCAESQVVLTCVKMIWAYAC